MRILPLIGRSVRAAALHRNYATGSTYADAVKLAREKPTEFWGAAAAGIDWAKPFQSVLAGTREHPQWFNGGELSVCHNALDRHVAAGHAAKTAIIYDSPVTGTKRHISYGALLERTARAAGALRNLGVKAGDRVLIYMPMIPEAMVAMLACARLGAIHSVVFGGFAPAELATRINDCAPAVVITASCGIEGHRVIPYEPLYTEGLRLATHKPRATVVVQREQHPVAFTSAPAGPTVDWHQAMAAATPADCVAVPANHPLYILYTSGTTGQPKGVVRTAGDHAVALKWCMEPLFGITPQDTWWASSDLGWVVGHSFMCYGPLLHGCTTVLYEGKPVGTPDPGAFFRVVAEHRVNGLFCAPTALRAIKKEDPAGAHVARHDLSSLRTLFLAGERSDPPTVAWAAEHLRVRVVDNYWQTETGSPVCTNPVGFADGPAAVPPGSVGLPVPGWDVTVLRHNGHPAAPGELGEVAVRLPLPPGALATLWQRDALYRDKYLTRFPGYYDTADAGFIDEHGLVHIMTRTDDVINVAGHRLSTGRLEEVVMQHAAVAECAVVRQNDALKGQVPVAIVVLAHGVTAAPADVAREVVQLIRLEVGAVASLRTVLVVPKLPKTRSGKTLRATMSHMLNGEPYRVPATIDDPDVLGTLEKVFAPHIVHLPPV